MGTAPPRSAGLQAWLMWRGAALKGCATSQIRLSSGLNEDRRDGRRPRGQPIECRAASEGFDAQIDQQSRREPDGYSCGFVEGGTERARGMADDAVIRLSRVGRAVDHIAGGVRTGARHAERIVARRMRKRQRHEPARDEHERREPSPRAPMSAEGGRHRRFEGNRSGARWSSGQDESRHRSAKQWIQGRGRGSGIQLAASSCARSNCSSAPIRAIDRSAGGYACRIPGSNA